KRFLDTRHMFERDSATRIANGDFQLVIDALGFDREDASRWHRISGIRCQIQKKLLEISLPRTNIRNGIHELNVQTNALALQAVLENTERCIESPAHIRLSDTLGRPTRQCQHSAKDSAAGLKRLLDLLEIVTKHIRR